MNAAPTAIPLDRFAIVVGVTGHRDIAPDYAAGASAQFDAILSELQTTYPSTPLVVMSALASGADLLAAEVAFARGLPVIACLPMALDAYQADFTGEADRQRFLDALVRCARVEVRSSAQDRERAYLDAALHVAYYSDLVVAFWDGRPGRGPGGAADVVDVRMSGFVDELALPASVPSAPEPGPVYHIVTPRAGEPLPADALSLIKRFPERFAQDKSAEEDFVTSLARLERLNADLAGTELGTTFAADIEGLRDRTGALSDRLQRRTFFFLYCLYATALIATAAQYSTWPFFKYAMFPIAFAAYKVAQHFDYENRYQDYRVLSEGLRVQAAWLSGGIREPAERSYLGMQQRELQWIRMALRYAYVAFHEKAQGGRVDAPGCVGWIAGQWEYFHTKPRREAAWLAQLQFASRVAFYVAVVASVACFAVLYVPTLPHALATALSKLTTLPPELEAWAQATARSARSTQVAWTDSRFVQSGWFEAFTKWDVGRHHDWLVRLSTGLLALYAAIALLISNYCDKRGFAMNVRRYDRMFVVFDRAKTRFDALAVKDSHAGVALVTELGRAALIENGEWLLTRRERPLNFVT